MKRTVQYAPLKTKNLPEAAAFPPIGTTLPSYGSGYTAAVPSAASVLMPRRSFKKGFKRLIITLLIIGLVAGGYVGVKFLINTHKLFGGNLFGLLQTTRLNGEDQGHVNILLAGNSADDPGHSGGQLTDSIMIVSIDTNRHTAFLVSIPRDLWVEVPHHGHQKINSVYEYGQADSFSEAGYPAGGMGLLEKTVSEDFGINVGYYALVDYTAFRDAVNSVGGIDLTIKSDDPRGLYDPNIDYTTGGPLVKLSNGTHHLNGQQALDLARARGDSYRSYGFPQSDFDRTMHQRQMLVALKDKILSVGTLSNPIRLGSVLDSFGNNVQTNFQTDEVRRLYDLTKPISSADITSAGLNDVGGQSLLRGYTAYGGQSALIPAKGLDDFSGIQAYFDSLLTPPAAPSGATR